VILTGLVLVAIGAADLVRAFTRVRARGAIGFAVVALAVIAVGVVAAAPVAIVVALVSAGVWVALMPHAGGGRAGAWPMLGLLVICFAGILVGGRLPGSGGGALATFPLIASPFGPLSVADMILLAGTVVFLLESGNVIVRSALALERVVQPPEAGAGRDVAGAPPMPPPPPAARASVLKGGRLIGPLERLLVFALTLTGAYTLLAAVIAAKGIVRFPEISRDGENGDRAEYFLVGSMVSWVTALAAALLVWWVLGSVGG
tara:strand:+ start:1517 stop:2296 length:780 start_codon:yes stop_codon:yes gene_type:complete